MGRKCSVFSCKRGYKTDNCNTPVKFYCFPIDDASKLKWIKALPNKLSLQDITKEMCVCSDHFPPNVLTGKWGRPVEPPSIFDNLKEKSCIGTPQPKERQTKKSSFMVRSQPDDPDKQLKDFNEKQKLRDSAFWSKLKKHLNKHYSDSFLLLDGPAGYISIISSEREGAVFKFSLFFSKKEIKDGVITDLAYEAYIGLRRAFTPCLDRNSITCWSQLKILLKHVCLPPVSDPSPAELSVQQKFEFIDRQVSLLNTPKNILIYNSADLLNAFSWYTCSRTLYTMLRDYFVLPSTTTLRKLTRKAKNVDDETLFTKMLNRQEERSRGVVLIFDEVYVKSTLTYSGELL